MKTLLHEKLSLKINSYINSNFIEKKNYIELLFACKNRVKTPQIVVLLKKIIKEYSYLFF